MRSTREGVGVGERPSAGEDNPNRGKVQMPIDLGYDPEAEVINRILVDPKAAGEIKWDDPTVEVDARLYEFNAKKDLYRIRHYGTKAKLLERFKRANRRFDWLRENGIGESDYFSLGGSSGQVIGQLAGTEMGGWLNNEYLPLMMGPFYRQLYLYDYLKMQALCFEAWNHHPVAKAVVNMSSWFTLGKGVTAKCKNEVAQREWDRFSSLNDLPQRVRRWSDELSIYGEIMIRHRVNRMAGMLTVRSIDPATVWEIVTDPDDIEHVYYYHQQYPTAYMQYVPIPIPGVPTQRFIMRQVPADEVIHIKVNVTSGERRGRSDLFAALPWLKRFKDFATAAVVREQALAAWAWHDSIKGGPADVAAHQAWLQANPPTAGEVLVTNEAIIRSYLGPEGTAAGGGREGSTADMLLNVISIATGIPKEYLGVSAPGARATALVATAPVTKKFEDRQLLIEYLMHQIADRVFAAAGIDRGDREIEFTFPSIATEDRSAKIEDLQKCVGMAWISHEQAAIIAAREMGITTYRYEKERQTIEDEIGMPPERVIMNGFQMVEKLAPPLAPAVVPPPGDLPVYDETAVVDQPMPGQDPDQRLFDDDEPVGQQDDGQDGSGDVEGPAPAAPPSRRVVPTRPTRARPSTPVQRNRNVAASPMTAKGRTQTRADLAKVEAVREVVPTGESHFRMEQRDGPSGKGSKIVVIGATDEWDEQWPEGPPATLQLDTD